jgi:hypothetical protein
VLFRNRREGTPGEENEPVEAEAIGRISMRACRVDSARELICRKHQVRRDHAELTLHMCSCAGDLRCLNPCGVNSAWVVVVWGWVNDTLLPPAREFVTDRDSDQLNRTDR